MNDSDHRDEIVRLETQIDDLAATIDSCRKFILAGRIAVIGGGAVLVAVLVDVIRSDLSVMAAAVAADAGNADSGRRGQGNPCCDGGGLQHAECVYFHVPEIAGYDTDAIL